MNMISEKENIRISKFLSFVLRHKPDAIDISLDESGWTNVETLIKHMETNGFLISREILNYVVATNNKKRFTFNDDQTLIRASQGHSIEVELGYQTVHPPLILYHGTVEPSLSAIFNKGLEKRNRHHVHLSEDLETALIVGKRYGNPVILQIDANAMFNDGFNFYLSENGVWLTDHVPAKYLSIHNREYL
jgi:putative RNA 2'-phosphotransferase